MFFTNSLTRPSVTLSFFVPFCLFQSSFIASYLCLLALISAFKALRALTALYEKMLSVQDEHLRTTQNKLESFVDEVLAKLTAEKKDKRKDR